MFSLTKVNIDFAIYLANKELTAYTPNKDDTQNDVTFTAYSLQSTSKLH